MLKATHTFNHSTEKRKRRSVVYDSQHPLKMYDRLVRAEKGV